MPRKATLVRASIALLVVLAGCSQGTDRVTLAANVDTVETDGDTYNVTVTSEDSTTDYQWQNVTVTGVAAGREVVCRADFGELDSDTSGTKTVTCGRPPLVFAVRSDLLNASVTYRKPTLAERIGRTYGTDTLLIAESVVLEDVTASGPVYDSPSRLAGGVAEREVGIFEYAKCKLRSNQVDPSVFDRPAHWLEWTPVTRSLNETRITVVNRTTTAVRYGNRTLKPIRLPDGNSTAEVRAAIRMAKADEADRTVYSVDVSGSELVALHTALRTDSDTRKTGPGLEQVRRLVERNLTVHAGDLSTLSVRPQEPCAQSPSGEVVVSGQVGAVYAVQGDGHLWEVRVKSNVTWVGRPRQK